MLIHYNTYNDTMSNICALSIVHIMIVTTVRATKLSSSEHPLRDITRS